MSDTGVLAQKVYQEAQEFPEESLLEIMRFMEFLRFKTRKAERAEEQRLDPVPLRNLRGILKGYDFSPEFIAEARREMWHKFHAEAG